MKILKYIAVFALALFTVVSCSDLLDVSPNDRISDDILWEDTGNADLFLNNIYAGLPNSFQQSDPEGHWADNTLSYRGYSRNIFRTSIYTPEQVQHRWGNYNHIRKANIFIENINASDFPEDWKRQRLGEARFLRAYYYMMLWTAHGGVPIITDVLNLSEQGDDVFRPRNTAEETYQFIVSELEEIANDLPPTAEGGRATRGAALTLKAWTELFWASPLYNQDNDISRWEASAATNKQVIDLGVYDLFPDYNDQFLEDNNFNEETIFARTYVGGTSLGGSREGYLGPKQINGVNSSWGGMFPTQELVDEYAMANGLPITDPESGYDPQNPYENREKRFYQSIVHDGAVWSDATFYNRPGSLNVIDLDGAGQSTTTGYYMRKGLNENYTFHGNNQLSSANFILFRYAEVLLSYAEAQNEAVGPDQSVYNAVNRVRDRSELPPLEVGLTQDEMREVIYRERRVELAFEERRWYDLLRLKLAEEKLNGPQHGMYIEEENGSLIYEVIPAAFGMRSFDPDKNYLLPIPQSAIERNPNLEQNPNY